MSGHRTSFQEHAQAPVAAQPRRQLRQRGSARARAREQGVQAPVMSLQMPTQFGCAAPTIPHCCCDRCVQTPLQQKSHSMTM